VKTLFKDEHIIIIDKPAGLPVLPDGWKPEAPYLLQMLEKQVGELWVVHRLDKVTSGVMIFARTAEAHRELNRQFEQREIHKTYHALLSGNPRWDEHTARHMLRTNVGKKHRTMVDDRRGKPSETHFKVLKRYQAGALVEATPTTGRTHQVRVHAYALGVPLLADELYSAPPTDLIERPALHARSLAFVHPQSGQAVEFTAPYPDDFASALKRLER
jgi:RluA family pseudouridine synthase